MKTFIIAIVLLVMIISSSFLYLYIINDVTSDMTSKLEKLEHTVRDDNWKQAEKQLDEIQRSLKKREGWMMALIDHRELDEIKMTVSRLAEYVHFKDTQEFMAESAVLKLLIEHLETKERVNWANLF